MNREHYCVVCGTEITLRRTHAYTCSARCRKRKSRMLQKSVAAEAATKTRKRKPTNKPGRPLGRPTQKV